MAPGAAGGGGVPRGLQEGMGWGGGVLGGLVPTVAVPTVPHSGVGAGRGGQQLLRVRAGGHPGGLWGGPRRFFTQIRAAGTSPAVPWACWHAVPRGGLILPGPCWGSRVLQPLVFGGCPLLRPHPAAGIVLGGRGGDPLVAHGARVLHVEPLAEAGAVEEVAAGGDHGHLHVLRAHGGGGHHPAARTPGWGAPPDPIWVLGRLWGGSPGSRWRRRRRGPAAGRGWRGAGS